MARRRLACCVALALSAFLCRADDAPAPSQKAPDVATTPRTATQNCVTATASGAPAAARQSPPIDSGVELARLHVPAASPRELPDFHFHDDGDLVRRLADMRTLPVMTLWQSRRTQIYLGVDQKGLAGLHFRQRGPGELSTLWRSTPDAPKHAAATALPQAPRSLAP
ncbi:MAG: hypothetical protein ACRETU_03235 [Steroidobacterales bacterium]